MALIFRPYWYFRETLLVYAPSANLALRELGIVMFLAVVGLNSGGGFIDTLIYGQGLSWIGYGIAITLLPLLIVGIMARLVLS